MTFLRHAVLVASLSLLACSQKEDTTEGVVSASEDELRSVARSFFLREPLSGRRMEALRRDLLEADDGYRWVRNQGTAFAVQWETSSQRALTPSQRVAVAQAAFGFRAGSRRALLRDVKVVDASDASLAASLDAIGLDTMSPADDDTTAKRTEILDALRTVAKTRSITVLTAKLEYQVDMYWEGALVVIDEENEQILFATGGYGT